ncbi:hypothetical protein CEXT_528141 [Caerostris extrusa]|uniref:Phosphofurin acidic cluster sorting protein 1/2 C-terminal domain-containing protein n=1 Tax=Caerostris extrusa TaxID=172846 RepID=A0AAV4MJE9_CAEEX|nr:hypothetical protein CEXT_528141 [Caerostris extrusa]
MYAISSQPVDHEEADRQKTIRGIERAAEVDNFSDEEEEYTSNEDGCDSEAVVEESATAGNLSHRSHLRKSLNPKMFQIPEAEVSDSEQYQEELEQELISQNPQEFEDLIDELESMSDSGPDVDDISISSTPKPSLRPFFSSGTLTALDKTPMISDDSSRKTDDNHESGTDQENTDTSQTASPPKSLTMDDKKTFHIQVLKRKENSTVYLGKKNASKDKRSSSSKRVILLHVMSLRKVPRESTTPPSSPSISSAFLGNNSSMPTCISASGETMDLQLDYWILPQKGEASKKGESSKLSLKTTFRTLHISRISSSVESGTSSLTLTYVTKEKKQKIMRLGKKKRERKRTG